MTIPQASLCGKKSEITWHKHKARPLKDSKAGFSLVNSIK